MLLQRKKSFKVRPQLIILYIMGLIMALSVALPAYVHSNFLNQFVSLKTVSLFFIIANIITSFFILSFPKILKRFGNRSTFKAIIVIFAFSLFLFSTANSAIGGLISLICFTVSFNLAFIKLDLFIEKFSRNKDTGKIRTIYLTFYNLGWVFAPSISSYLIKTNSYGFVYWLAGALLIPAFIIFLFYSPQLKSSIKYERVNLFKVMKKMWQNNNLRGIFIIALILQLFYTTAVVYVPLYLHQNLGMSWQTLGPIFSIMLLPFLLFELPAGILADKYFGEKEIMTIGLLILTLSLFLFFYIDVTTTWIWAIVLFFSRTGAALVEAMRESYFFKLVNAKDIGPINIFRLTGPLAYIIGPLLAILVISFLPINYLFFFFAFVTASGAIIALSLKDSL